MKSIISFDVHGSNLDNLHALALKTYRELLNKPDAELPHSATIEVSPDTVVEATDGTRVATDWLGTVSVVIAADGAR